MTDRLKELKLGGQVQVSIDDDGGPIRAAGRGMDSDRTRLAQNDVHGGSAGGYSSSDAPGSPSRAQIKSSMVQFFEDVDMLKKKISAIKEATTKISELTQESILATSHEKETALSAQINPLVQASNKDAHFSKKMLNALKEQTQGIEQDISKGVNTTSASDLRIRQNLLNTLQRKFVEVMKEYQAAQAKYKTEIVKKTKRQVQIVKPDATDEEMDAVIRSGGADKLIQEQILTGEANESIKFMASNINDRYNEIIAIEASVQELHQLFLDMALLVEQQGELLDSIEYQVQQTDEHVEKGNLQLVGAIKHMQNIRRTQLYCCCALLVIVGIVVLIIIIMEEEKGGGPNSNNSDPTHAPTRGPSII